MIQLCSCTSFWKEKSLGENMTKQTMINDFEKRYWNIDEGIKAMLMKQSASQLSAKLTEWADFAEQPRLEF